MKVEVIIRFKGAFNSETFIKGLPEQGEKEKVLKGTDFEKTPDMIRNVRYAHEDLDGKLILFDYGVNMVMAHLVLMRVALSLG